MDTPISLEDLCYLHIISHLENYPLHHLAKLSYAVRRRLLQNLPASDIIELENICVADGIGDLKNEVWKQSRVCQSFSNKNLQRELGARRSLLSVALNYLFASASAPVDTHFYISSRMVVLRSQVFGHCRHDIFHFHCLQ